MGGHHKGTVYHKGVSFKRICSLLVQTTATSSSAYYVIIICLTCHHLHAMSCHAVSSSPTGSFFAPIPCQISNPTLWTAAPGCTQGKGTRRVVINIIIIIITIIVIVIVTTTIIIIIIIIIVIIVIIPARAPAPGALRWPCVPGCPPRGQTPVARQRLQLLLQSSSLSSA